MHGKTIVTSMRVLNAINTGYKERKVFDNGSWMILGKKSRLLNLNFLSGCSRSDFC